MSENYKPGTVAVATVRGVEGVRVYRGLTGWAAPADPGRGLNVGVLHESDVTDVRPLVVLDPGVAPEFTVSALRMHIDTARTQGFGVPSIVARLADQIEAQTRPPKPTEPTGLGAVVEDAEGRKWVRDPNGHWHGDGMNYIGGYFLLDAVRVLSEGVEVDR